MFSARKIFKYNERCTIANERNQVFQRENNFNFLLTIRQNWEKLAR